MLHRLIDIEALVICAVNGPATIDAELMVMGDITLAADHAVFVDEGHFIAGEAPGDGVHLGGRCA